MNSLYKFFSAIAGAKMSHVGTTINNSKQLGNES